MVASHLPYDGSSGDQMPPTSQPILEDESISPYNPLLQLTTVLMPLESLKMNTTWWTSTSPSSDMFPIDPGPGLDQSDLRLPLYLRCTATTICVILLLIGCPGNMLVPYVVLKTKDLRNSTNIFLINLSISDVLVLIISTPTVLIELHSQPEVWFLGSFVCKAVSFVEICVAHSSILTILAISFERYYAICRPLEAGYKCTKRRAIVIIIFSWIIALVSTLPMLSITETSRAEFIDGSMVTVCSNSLREGWHPIYYFIIFITFFLIPFLILIFLYVVIARRLTSDSKSLASSCTNPFKRQTQVRRQVVMMLASVCVTFFICLLPFRLMTLWIILSTSEDIVKLGMETYYVLLFLCRILLYVNSSANPILYNLISSKFRSAFCRVLNLQQVRIMRRPYDHSVLSDKTSTTLTKASIRGHSVASQKSSLPLPQRALHGRTVASASASAAVVVAVASSCPMTTPSLLALSCSEDPMPLPLEISLLETNSPILFDPILKGSSSSYCMMDRTDIQETNTEKEYEKENINCAHGLFPAKQTDEASSNNLEDHSF